MRRKPISFRPKDDNIEKWINAQSPGTMSDAINYLIEKEIHENGTRDLCKFVPAHRDKEYFMKLLQLSSGKDTSTIRYSSPKRETLTHTTEDEAELVILEFDDEIEEDSDEGPIFGGAESAFEQYL